MSSFSSFLLKFRFSFSLSEFILFTSLYPFCVQNVCPRLLSGSSAVEVSTYLAPLVFSCSISREVLSCAVQITASTPCIFCASRPSLLCLEIFPTFPSRLYGFPGWQIHCWAHSWRVHEALLSPLSVTVMGTPKLSVLCLHICGTAAHRASWAAWCWGILARGEPNLGS